MANSLSWPARRSPRRRAEIGVDGRGAVIPVCNDSSRRNATFTRSRHIHEPRDFSRSAARRRRRLRLDRHPRRRSAVEGVAVSTFVLRGNAAERRRPRAGVERGRLPGLACPHGSGDRRPQPHHRDARHILSYRLRRERTPPGVDRRRKPQPRARRRARRQVCTDRLGLAVGGGRVSSPTYGRRRQSRRAANDARSAGRAAAGDGGPARRRRLRRHALRLAAQRTRRDQRLRPKIFRRGSRQSERRHGDLRADIRPADQQVDADFHPSDFRPRRRLRRRSPCRPADRRFGADVFNDRRRSQRRRQSIQPGSDACCALLGSRQVQRRRHARAAAVGAIAQPPCFGPRVRGLSRRLQRRRRRAHLFLPQDGSVPAVAGRRPRRQRLLRRLARGRDASGGALWTVSRRQRHRRRDDIFARRDPGSRRGAVAPRRLGL